MEEATIVVTISGGLLDVVYVPQHAVVILLDYDEGDEYRRAPHRYARAFGQPDTVSSERTGDIAVRRVVRHSVDQRLDPCWLPGGRGSDMT